MHSLKNTEPALLENVILVDENDRETGVMEKMAAHVSGSLHRAFSVFIFNDAGELLLQKRADHKYHSGGLWTNTCCSHPRPGEHVSNAALRRLKEELGFTCDIRPAFTFLYRSELDNGLTEHEFDHVFFGRFNGTPLPDSTEVAEWKFMSLPMIEAELSAFPESYTSWFSICFEQVLAHSQHNNLQAL
jgi:isopentenyl-diphosphate delta-isomerase